MDSDVTSFIQKIIRNTDAFAGFGIRGYENNYVTLDPDASLIIETAEVAEPVPEPTAIFGSAIGLCLGGWLKQKKSTSQNKAKSQA
jgi:hypothetical protein